MIFPKPPSQRDFDLVSDKYDVGFSLRALHQMKLATSFSECDGCVWEQVFRALNSKPPTPACNRVIAYLTALRLMGVEAF